MQRRGILRLGGASALLLAAGAITASWLRSSVAPVNPAAVDVLRNAGRAMLEGTIPQGADASSALDGLVERIERTVEGLPPHAQDEIAQLLAVLSTSVGRRGLSGVREDWATATSDEIRAGLQSMRISPISLRQQAYQALHDLVYGAYFASSETWGLLGYPGPTPVERT